MRPHTTLENLEARRLLHGSPAITVGDVTLVESDAGQSAIVFTVSLSKPSTKRVSVEFFTANGSAVVGEDYVSKRGTLDFARGQTSKAVSVLVNGDTTVEGDETFSLKLRHASNSFIADTRALGTIVNDDVLLPPPPPVDPPPYEPPPDPGYDPTYGGQGDPGYGYNPYSGGAGEYPSY